MTHNFKGYKNGDKIEVDGSCDVNIWYAYDNDTKTIVTNKTITYRELLNVVRKKESDINSEEEIIVRSLKQPTCTKVDIVNNTISYDIEKEEEDLMEEIDKGVNENFINETDNNE